MQSGLLDKPARMYAAAGPGAKGVVAKALAAPGEVADPIEPDRINPGSPKDSQEGDRRRRNSNLVALGVVVVLVLLAYWAFTALDHSRRNSSAALTRAVATAWTTLARQGNATSDRSVLRYGLRGAKRVRSARPLPTHDVQCRFPQ